MSDPQMTVEEVVQTAADNLSDDASLASSPSPASTPEMPSALSDAGTGGGSPTPSSGAVDAGAVSPSAGKAPEKAAPTLDPEIQDILDKGYKNTIRIPKERVAEMLAKQKTSWAKLHDGKREKEVAEWRDKHNALEKQIQQDAAWQNLAATNPEQFVRELAKVAPDKYGRFAAVLDAKEAQKAQTPTERREDPMPQPDAADGGYTKEGLAALLKWTREQAVADSQSTLKAELDARFKPMEDERKAIAMDRQTRATATSQMAQLTEIWGADLLKAHDKELAAMTKANPGMDPFAVAARVLRPIEQKTLVTDRQKMRDELLEELKAAPAGASGGGHASGKVSEKTPQTVEEIVAAVAAGMR